MTNTALASYITDDTQLTHYRFGIKLYAGEHLNADHAGDDWERVLGYATHVISRPRSRWTHAEIVHGGDGTVLHTVFPAR